MEEEHILFKWGSLKSWNLKSEKGKELLRKYIGLGSSASVMLQHDTEEQKEIICQMIDECSGSLSNDWDGNKYTKQQAKDYVMNYGKKS